MRLNCKKLALLSIVLTLGITNTVLADKVDNKNKPLYDEAIKLITIGTDNQIFEHFLKQRSAPLTAEQRAFYKKELFNRPDLATTPLFDSATPAAKALSATIEPVLIKYQRQGTIETVVLDQKAPFIGMYRESIFIVTTSVLKMLTPDEIRASFAHELAHACFIEELITADRTHDKAAHHLVEYKCDLIAALALNDLGQDPFTLIDAVAKIENHYKRNSSIQPFMSGHPDSVQRKQCLQDFLSNEKARRL
jgi:peptidase M48-like protein